MDTATIATIAGVGGAVFGKSINWVIAKARGKRQADHFERKDERDDFSVITAHYEKIIERISSDVEELKQQLETVQEAHEKCLEQSRKLVATVDKLSLDVEELSRKADALEEAGRKT
jgi:predicted RNase H-like nuclease (RuvC/YqgF family)